MEVTERREGWKEEESANRQGGSELDMSVATVSESSDERNGVEERREGMSEQSRDWVRDSQGRDSERTDKEVRAVV